MTQKELKDLFDYDYKNGGLIWKVNKSTKVRKGDKFGFIESGKKPYVKGMINYKTYREHRLVWIWHNGNCKNNLEIDHINRIHFDNRIENLREVTKLQNMRNRKNNYFKYAF